jgi:hypothetical protein
MLHLAITNDTGIIKLACPDNVALAAVHIIDSMNGRGSESPTHRAILQSRLVSIGGIQRKRSLLLQYCVALALFDLIDDQKSKRRRTDIDPLMPMPNRFNDEVAGFIYRTLSCLHIGDLERSR